MKTVLNKFGQKAWRRHVLFAVLLFCAVSISVLTTHTTGVLACIDCQCTVDEHGSAGDAGTTRDVIADEHRGGGSQKKIDNTKHHIQDEYGGPPNNPPIEQRAWLLDRVFGDWLHPMWMMMAEQFTMTAMHQMLAIGVLMDSEQQLYTQRLYQELAAEAYKDYQPSFGVCLFASNIKSIAHTERLGEYSAFVLSQHAIDRQMGNRGTAAARGPKDDHAFRLNQFRGSFCQPKDNNQNNKPNTGLQVLCSSPSSGFTINRDVDYTRAIDKSPTLGIDFTNQGPDNLGDERTVIGLMNNLYDHDILYRMEEEMLDYYAHQDEVVDYRSIVAKRSMAQHSYNSIAGMRALGSPGFHDPSKPPNDPNLDTTWPYTEPLLKLLGINDQADIEWLLAGDASRRNPDLHLRPSYYTQMEVLTKKIFQYPYFYIDLYDKPANVDRKHVVLQALGLMQDFDIWNSHLRTEAMLSVVLELEIMNLQNDAVNRIRSLADGERLAPAGGFP